MKRSRTDVVLMWGVSLLALALWILFALLWVGLSGCTAIDDFGAFHQAEVADLGHAEAPDLAETPVIDLMPCGVCRPGEQRVSACGQCGMLVLTCTQRCEWFVGVCTGQGVCVPGATACPCPAGASGVGLCSASCSWESTCNCS